MDIVVGLNIISLGGSRRGGKKKECQTEPWVCTQLGGDVIVSCSDQRKQN